MNLRTILSVTGALGLFTVSSLGQSCPKISTGAQYDAVKQGTPATITATVKGGSRDLEPTYNWSVSSGTVSSGQGTPTITVDTSEAEVSITATVEIGGLYRSCSNSSSFTIAVQKMPTARQIDEFGGVIPSEINKKLDDFFIELGSDPTATGYIIAYPTRAAPSSASLFLTRATAQARQRGVDVTRIKTIEGGMRSVVLIQLWIVPDGAPVPKVDPVKGHTASTPARKSR